MNPRREVEQAAREMWAAALLAACGVLLVLALAIWGH